MKRVVNSIVLLIIAVGLASFLLPFGLLFSIYYGIRTFKPTGFAIYLSDLFYSVALGIDKIGNVILAALLNRVMLHRRHRAYLFGDINDTISRVLALNLPLKYDKYQFKNKGSRKLTWGGWYLVCILEWIDPGHMEKSLKGRY